MIEIHICILNSELGKAERALHWGRFKQFLSDHPQISAIETEDLHHADIVFLATGGAECLYTSQYIDGKTPTAFIAPPGTNAYAASNEIRAYLSLRRQGALFYQPDLCDIEEFAVIARARRLMREARIAMFGEPAPWLVASIPKIDAIAAKFGTAVVHESWESLHWPEENAADDIVRTWQAIPSDPLNTQELMNACRLSSALRRYAWDHKVSAITVGCFPLLAQHVSACLAVADLLDAGIAAACENDLCAALAMLTAIYLDIAKKPVWMANLVSANGKDITLQHCTIARSCLTDIRLMTHFESGANAAIGGRFADALPVTVFRYDKTLSRACAIQGRITESGPNPSGCRTSASIHLESPMQTPLGNHHIMIQDHCADRLKAFCTMMNITVNA